jgi:hypothetical protein
VKPNCRENPPPGALSRLETVGRLRAPLLALVLGAVAALGLVACGSGGSADLLPGATASEITENLDTVKELSAEGECIGAENAAQEISTQIDALGGVDKQLKQVLREGAERLTQVVEECVEPVEEEVEPAIEAEEEVEPPGKSEKPEKEGEAKAKQEAEEPPAEGEGNPNLPPQAKGKAKGKDGEPGPSEAPPAETEGGGTGAPSGGIGAGEPAAGE